MATSLLRIFEYNKNAFTDVTDAEKQTNLTTFIQTKYLSYHYILMWNWKYTEKEMNKSVSRVKCWHLLVGSYKT